MEIVREKAFPDNYNDSVLDVIQRMSLTDLKGVKIMGSAAIRSQQYAGDYDCHNKVTISSFDTCAKDIQDVIKRIREDCYITDFKIGEVPEWDVVKGTLREGKLDFKLLESLSVLDKLKADKIISEAEYKGAERMLRNVDSDLTFIEAKKGIRFHVLRWKPLEILEGEKTARGYRINLEDALASGGMVKLDLIASIQTQFTEFSMIYNLFLQSNDSQRYRSREITPHLSRAEIQEALKQDIIYYNHRSPFKALKRSFSLAKMLNKTKDLEEMLPILNSDLGRLYQIVGDLASLRMLLEQGTYNNVNYNNVKPPSTIPLTTQVKDNLDEMRARMGSIYSLKEFLDAEHEIIGRIESMRKMPIKTLKPAIYSLFTQLQGILNESTLKKIKSL